MFPENIVKTMIFQTKSVMVESQTQTEEIQEVNVDSTNNLGMVIVSITFGFALRSTQKTSGAVINFFEGLSTGFSKIIEWIVNFGPVGILSLVWYQTLKIENISMTLSQMGLYILTILIVLFIHAWVFMPFVFSRFMNMLSIIISSCSCRSTRAGVTIASWAISKKHTDGPEEGPRGAKGSQGSLGRPSALLIP